MQPQTTGDAWRYCTNLDSPEAVHALVQAALTATLTIAHARANASAAELPKAADWDAVLAELRAALHAVGHPAGE